MKTIHSVPSDIILDMHVHTDASPDSKNDILSLVRRAVSIGINGFAVCDHNRIISSEKLKETICNSGLDKELNIEVNPLKPCKNAFYIIGGGEYAFEGSHVLGIFMDDIENAPSSFKNVSEYIEYVKDHGGYTVLAHPYEHLPIGEEPKLSPDMFDFIEVFNARADHKHGSSNSRAMKLSEKLSAKISAGSDAHFKTELASGLILAENIYSKALLPSYDELKKSFFEKENKLFYGKPSPRRMIPKSSFMRHKKHKNIKGMIKSSVLYLVYFTADILYPQKEIQIKNIKESS